MFGEVVAGDYEGEEEEAGETAVVEQEETEIWRRQFEERKRRWKWLNCNRIWQG